LTIEGFRTAGYDIRLPNIAEYNFAKKCLSTSFSVRPFGGQVKSGSGKET